MTTDNNAEAAARQAADAERLEAWQWHGYWEQVTYHLPRPRNVQDEAAYSRGLSDIRPDADALAAARAEGYAAGRESVLNVVRDSYRFEYHAGGKLGKQRCAAFMGILRTCNAATGTGEGQ
jgi:hypothetical protein